MAIPDVVNRDEIAKLLGVDRRSIANYAKLPNPIPRHIKGRSVTYPLAKVIAWWTQYQVEQATEGKAKLSELDMAKQRKEIAIARMREVEADRMESQVADVGDYRRELATVLDLVRTKMVALPSRVAPLVLGLETIGEVVAAVDPMVAEILSELSAPDALPELQEDDNGTAAA